MPPARQLGSARSLPLPLLGGLYGQKHVVVAAGQGTGSLCKTKANASITGIGNGTHWPGLVHGSLTFSYRMDQTEEAMKRDFLIISTVLLGVNTVVSNFWFTQDKLPRMYTHQHLNADPNLKLVSEQSPFMRTER
jgi:hypothetical protein